MLNQLVTKYKKDTKIQGKLTLQIRNTKAVNKSPSQQADHDLDANNYKQQFNITDDPHAKYI